MKRQDHGKLEWKTKWNKHCKSDRKSRMFDLFLLAEQDICTRILNLPFTITLICDHTEIIMIVVRNTVWKINF